jgi:hypothetical protein
MAHAWGVVVPPESESAQLGDGFLALGHGVVEGRRSRSTTGVAKREDSARCGSDEATHERTMKEPPLSRVIVGFDHDEVGADFRRDTRQLVRPVADGCVDDHRCAVNVFHDVRAEAFELPLRVLSVRVRAEIRRAHRMGESLRDGIGMDYVDEVKLDLLDRADQLARLGKKVLTHFAQIHADDERDAAWLSGVH